MIKVSVIITTYGNPVFLEKCIESVFNQSLKDIELIIVDDNDSDTEARFLTEKTVDNFIKSERNITYLKHEFNQNGAAARNTGIAVASGKYISFLDNDDEYHVDRLHKCYEVMEMSDETVAGVYTGCELKRNEKTYHILKNVLEGNFLKETLACTFKFSTGSNIFVRKSVVNELNAFDIQFLRHQDYEFLVRLFQKYSLKAIPEVLVIKNNENFNLPNVYKMIEIKEQFLSKFSSIIKRLEVNEQKYIYHSHYISIAEHGLRTKEFKISSKYYLKAKDYGALTLKNRYRKVIFTILNYIK